MAGKDLLKSYHQLNVDGGEAWFELRNKPSPVRVGIYSVGIAIVTLYAISSLWFGWWIVGLLSAGVGGTFLGRALLWELKGSEIWRFTKNEASVTKQYGSKEGKAKKVALVNFKVGFKSERRMGTDWSVFVVITDKSYVQSDISLSEDELNALKKSVLDFMQSVS